jgi:NAD+ diphosphatase
VSWQHLVFCRAMVDRAAHRRGDAAWLAEAWPGARVLVVGPRGDVLVSGGDDSPKLALLPSADVPEGERLFLGADGERAYFAIAGDLPDVEGAHPEQLRTVGDRLDAYDQALLAEAIGLVNWRRSYLYSPVTGARLVPQSAGWELAAEDGSGVIWPRTNPAIIVLVHDGVPGGEGQCLLTRQPNWPAGRYSCVAGFVEPGESAEAAVHREVFEETGVEIREVSYVASQPWPVPASLMLGFTALGDPSQPVVVGEDELEDARWFTRARLLGPDSPLGPSPVSISHHLITAWRDASG